MPWETTVHLKRDHFTESEQTLADYDGLTASTFLFRSGVHGLRVINQIGQIILLPFQGQQIWHAEFHGRTLTMKSMFDQPWPTTEFLQTYGAFMIHCGATAMGVPGEQDSHPPHGELPNAPYQTARLLIGQEERGPYMGLTGSYQHTVAFNDNYLAQPLVKLYADSGRIPISMRVSNLKRSAMELMYLAHVNFRPIDNGQLVYSAPCDPAHVRVRDTIPSHIHPAPGYRAFLAELAEHPDRHNVLEIGLMFDPEVVFYLDYLADELGWAHSMQIHPDGTADFISHRPAELEKGIRWISRTPDQDALGIVLPATAEPEGYTAEKAKGHLKVLPPGGEFYCAFEVGMLSATQAGAMQATISRTLSA